jgi:hypothetical protein
VAVTTELYINSTKCPAATSLCIKHRQSDEWTDTAGQRILSGGANPLVYLPAVGVGKGLHSVRPTTVIRLPLLPLKRYTLLSIMKPTWCTFHSIYWELRASTCFKHYLLILTRCYTNGTGILRACYVSWLRQDYSSTPILVQATDITYTRYTKCRLWSPSRGWASNARNM